jgi:hypothetical protein
MMGLPYYPIRTHSGMENSVFPHGIKTYLLYHYQLLHAYHREFTEELIVSIVIQLASISIFSLLTYHISAKGNHLFWPHP